MKKIRNTRKCLMMVIVALSLILALLLCAAVVMDLPEQGEEQAPETTESVNASVSEDAWMMEETEGPSDKPEDMIISTEFCDLHFPGTWHDQVRTEYAQSDVGGALTFYGAIGTKEAELFTVLFSRSVGGSGSPVGVLDLDGQAVLVSIKIGELMLNETWTEDDLNTFAAMRDGKRYLIGRLSEHPGFSEDYDAYFAGQQIGDLIISTPFGNLRYPGTWGDQVWTEFTQSGDGGFVTFCGAVGGEDVPLFAIHFGTDSHAYTPVGFLRDNGLSLEIGAEMLEDDGGHSAEDMDTITSMREGINDVLMSLRELPGFTTEEGGSGTQENGEDLVVFTPYVDLYLPGQWADCMDAEVESTENGYAVYINGTVGAHEAKLFAVFFGAVDGSGVPIGMLNVDGTSVEVTIEIEDLASNAWSDEETDAFSAMQESINYLMERLEQSELFQPLS